MSQSMWLGAVLCCAVGGTLIALGLRRPSGSNGEHIVGFTAPSDSLPVVSGDELLARNAGLVHSIRNKLGLSHANLEADWTPIVRSYARFVQALPASESHHHAQPGGLLQHTLEVVDHALTFRRAYVLPVNSEAERVNKLKHAWTFGVALAALFHDIGKAMSDLHVTLLGPDCPRDGRAWHPMAGHMDEQGGRFYRVHFDETRSYKQHARLGVMLMQRIVPARTMAWLSEQDSDLLKQLLDVLSNPECDNELKQIIKKADSESARNNLLSGPRSRFKTAREVPLIELIDTGLERLLQAGQFRLNIPGGHGFVWDGPEGYGDLLLVVPRIIDALREHLRTALVEGSRGIPSDNLTIYGTLQDYGRIRPTVDGKAVWRVQVEGIPKSLTVLRFSKGCATFRSLDDWPSAFAGDIRADGVSTEDDRVSDAEETPRMRQVKAETLEASHLDLSNAANAGIQKAKTSNDADVSPSPGHPQEKPFWMDDGLMDGATSHTPNTESMPALSVARARESEAQAVETARAMGGLMPPEETEMDSPTTPNSAVTHQPTATTKKSIRPMKDPTNSSRLSATDKADVQAFEDWLRIGLMSGHLHYNSGRAALHFYRPEGEPTTKTIALLITPAIYQRYVKERDREKWLGSETSEIPKDEWVPLQTAFLKAHAHRSVGEGKIRRTIFKYATKGSGVFACNVLTAPERLFQEVPEPNPYISGEVKPHMISAVAAKI